MHHILTLTAASPWRPFGLVCALVTSFRLLPAKVDVPFRRPLKMPVWVGGLSLVLDASDLESSNPLRIRCGGMIENPGMEAVMGMERGTFPGSAHAKSPALRSRIKVRSPSSRAPPLLGFTRNCNILTLISPALVISRYREGI